MFTFALITCVKNGWLDPATYGPAARKGWLALVGYIDQNADVTSVCEGTGKKNDLDYYLARARRTRDFHGQAPCCDAPRRYCDRKVRNGDPADADLHSGASHSHKKAAAERLSNGPATLKMYLPIPPPPPPTVL
jgi:glycosyl hydrolase family 88